MKKTYSMRPLRYNSILWITGLAGTDKNPSRRSIEDIGDLSKVEGIDFAVMEIKNRDAFFKLMEYIVIDCQETGNRPILHLDFHGSETQGLELSHSGERVSWNELYSCLQKINLVLKNDLLVVAGVCFGMTAISGLDIHSVVAFNWFIAPIGTIKVGELDPGLALFYKSVILNADIQSAQLKHLPTMECFFSERFLARLLTNYYIAGCHGKAKRERLEKVLTEYGEEYGFTENKTVNNVRKAIKHQMTSTTNQTLFDKYADRFLLRTDLEYGFSDMLELVTKEDQA